MARFPFELVSPDKLLFNGAGAVGARARARGRLPGAQRPCAGHDRRCGPASSTSTRRSGKHLRVFRARRLRRRPSARPDVLAETAIPVEDLNAAHLDQEIKNAEEDVADASDDQKQAAQEKLDRLRELRDSMKLGEGGHQVR